MKRRIIYFSLTFVAYFFPWFILYKINVNTLPIQSEDTVPTIFTTVALVENGTLYLDNYYQMMINKYPNPDDKSYVKGLVPFYVKKVGSHYLSAFPIVTSVLAAPVFYVGLLLFPFTWELLIILTHLASSLIMALASLAFYLLLKDKFDLKDKKLFLATIIFSFANINFALFSQGLWQTATVELFTILGLYFILSKDTKYLLLSGLFTGIAVLARPTALLIYVMLFLLLSLTTKLHKNFFDIKRLKPLVFFGLGIIPSLVFFIWYNNTFYVDLANQGYSKQLFVGWQSPFPEGFLGIWLSPSKGILVYSPIFIFSLIGFYLGIKQKDLKFVIFGITTLLHTLVMGFWKHWYGGYGFGYRMAGEVIPFLTLLIVPFMKNKNFEKFMGIFYVLLVVSVLVQLMGLAFFDGIWHSAYDLGFKNTGWLWSITDSEVMFNLRRILVKFSILDKACDKCL